MLVCAFPEHEESGRDRGKAGWGVGWLHGYTWLVIVSGRYGVPAAYEGRNVFRNESSTQNGGNCHPKLRHGSTLAAVVVHQAGRSTQPAGCRSYINDQRRETVKLGMVTVSICLSLSLLKTAWLSCFPPPSLLVWAPRQALQRCRLPPTSLGDCFVRSGYVDMFAGSFPSEYHHQSRSHMGECTAAVRCCSVRARTLHES